MPSANLIAAFASPTITNPQRFPVHLHGTPTGYFALVDAADYDETHQLFLRAAAEQHGEFARTA
jgi:hypothetical protein